MDFNINGLEMRDVSFLNIKRFYRGRYSGSILSLVPVAGRKVFEALLLTESQKFTPD